MKVLLYVTSLFVLTNNIVFSLPDAKISKIIGEIPEEQCSNIGCLLTKSVKYFTSCGQLTTCTDCKINPERQPLHICSGWKVSKSNKLQLATGSIQSYLNVGSQSFQELRTDWIKNEPIDISRCEIESFNYRKAYSAFSIGQYTALYSIVTLQVSIINISKKIGKKKVPNIEIDLDLDETLEELDYRAMNRRARRDKSLCPITHSNIPLKLKQKTKEEVTLISKSFSVPLYRSKIYRPTDFKIKVKCEKKMNCDMKVYKFCLKISCSRMTETQFSELKIVEELLKDKQQLEIGIDNSETEHESSELEIEDYGEKYEEKSKEGLSNIKVHQKHNNIERRPLNERRIARDKIINNEERVYSQVLNNDFENYKNNKIYIILILIIIIVILLFILILKKKN